MTAATSSRRVGRSRRVWRGARAALRRPSIAFATVVITFWVIVLLTVQWWAPYDPFTEAGPRLQAPNGQFWFGTDELGRDMLTRLIYGGRLSWFMGIVPVALAFVIGTFLGVIAGFVGGRTNMLIMRVTDVFYAFPSVLLAVAISGALGAGIFNAILALTLVFIPQIIRVAETVTQGVRNLDFVDAARASGASGFTIVRVHILGNVLGPIFVYATGLISVCMIIASGLSFLGLGTKPPEPEWGLMLNTLRTAIYVNPWVAALPGAMIFAVSICFNLLSDGMRSAMDIRN